MTWQNPDTRAPTAYAKNERDVTMQASPLPLKPIAEIRRSHRRLTDHLATMVTAEGEVFSHCESRVLESALMLRLLEAERTEPAVQARIRGFLAGSRATARLSAVDQLLLAAVLDRRPPLGPEVVDGLMNGFHHFTAARKRVLLQSILYAAEAIDTVVLPQDSALEARQFQSWKQVEMTAGKCLILHGLGHPERVTEEELTTLATAVGTGRLWEGNLLVHLMALHALRRYPGYRQHIRNGLPPLLAAQRPDGGFSLTPGIECTGFGGMSLVEAGVESELQARMGRWLVSTQTPSGGWTYNPLTEQTDVETTALSLETLLRIDRHRYAHHLTRGCAYLESLQNPDGGYPIYNYGNPSAVAQTGEALSVLAQHDPGRYAARITRGARFLMDSQQRDGTFDVDWHLSEAASMMRAVHALEDALEARVLPDRTAHAARNVIQRTVKRLIDTRHQDGGWGYTPTDMSNPVSTGFALTALAMAGIRTGLHEGASYLCARQDPDGNIPACLDGSSPRMFPIEVKSVTAALILRGLTHALHSIQDTATGTPSTTATASARRHR
ncbi:prenyltransferase/squalene oxidase repeat-containing protein [Streptomyces fumanus]|uniref:Squalene cyclase C-terminal domain-containing protein n=1 Tax=Streptomyces fumanus TaxID=67302 RepID=A0A919AC27_9ACTN|nr:prenyltransferase/squalene oxidase repeat-containing protein [Streptomyces fumanus]GHE98531.1 hypothetical protein GCM10018772_23700 [Streptomyces fumanus]